MATVTASISAQQSYYGSATSSDFIGAIGMPSGYYAAYSMRFRFTVSKPCTALSIRIKPSQNVGSAGAFSWKITTSATFPTSGLNSASWSGTSARTLTSSASYAAGTTYYLWIIGSTASYSYVTGVTTDAVTITGTVRNYTVTAPAGTGYSWSPASASVAHGESQTFTLAIGAAYRKGPSFEATASNGTLTDNGDGTWTLSNVTAASTITVTGVELAGLVRIANGSGFEEYQPYIYNGTEWVQYMPYIYSGSAWELYS